MSDTSTMVGNLVVVAAFESEISGLVVRDADTILITGLGKVSAAIAVTRYLSRLGTDQLAQTEVINLGTCGALRPGLRGVFEPGVVINHEVNADVIRALGVEPDERIELAHGDADVVLATGDVFVDDVRLRDRLAERASLVDMEGFAVAAACRAFDVPVRLVKHVSDDADADAADWAANVHVSARDIHTWWQENVVSTW